MSAMNPFVEVMLRSTRRVWDIVTHLYHKWSIPVYLLANGQLLNVADNVSDLVPATDRVLRVSYAIVNLNIDWRIMRHALHDAPPLSPRRPAKRRRSTSPPSSQPSPAIPQIPLPPPPSLPPQRFIGSRRTYASPPSTQDASQNPSPPSHPSPSAKRPKFIPQSPPVQRVQDPHARDDDDFWTGNVPFSPAPLVTNALTACNKAVAFSSAAQSSTGQVQKARQQPSKVARRRARSCNTSESILNLVSTITAPTHASQVAQSGEHAVMQRLRSHLEQLQPHQPQLVPNASAHTIPSTNDLSVSLGNRSDVPQIPDAFLKTATIFEIPPIETSLPDSLLSLGHSNLQIDTPPNSNLVKDIRHQSAQQVQSEGKEQDPESDDEKLDIHLLDNLPDVVQPSAGEHVKDMPTVDVPVDLLCPENLDDDDFNLGKHVFGDSILFQTTDANRLKTGDSASVGGIGGNGSLNFSGLLSRLNEES